MSLLTVVLITVSTHIPPSTVQNGQEYKFNNDNYGIGLEYKEEVSPMELTLGAYTFNNSYENQSVAVSVAKQWEYGGFGMMFATGYENTLQETFGGFAIVPEITLRYKNVRIQTSYPFGKMIQSYDVVNLQFVYDIEI